MKDCIFCKIGRHQARSWMIAESDQAFAILDIHPMNRWHTIVMPKDHYVNIFDIPLPALQAVLATLKQVVGLYQERLGLDAVQIISNSGTLAQQDVFHSHWHIAPRYEGDGQDVQWQLHPEMVADYDAMLKELGTGKFVDAPLR